MTPKVLVLGYGNPGRLDDGLGPALAEAIGAMALPGVTVDADYQLAVEDAAQVAAHDYVVFADASVSGPEPFSFKPVQPVPELSFSSHSLQPEAVLAMAKDLFDARTHGFALAIRGHEFDDFGERLSDRASQNLAAALAFLADLLRSGALAAYVEKEVRSTDKDLVVLEMTPTEMN
jgi:hydrogenase maturation protease